MIRSLTSGVPLAAWQTAVVPRLLAMAAAVSLALLPLFLVTYPPLDDYPNHLARMHVLAAVDTAAALDAIYEPAWTLVPNLAMDLIVPPLTTLMPVELATKLMLAASLCLIMSGTIALNAALFGTLAWWPLAGLLLLYNRVVTLGFINFLTGIGLFLWALAGWVWLRERAPLVRLLVFVPAGSVMFVCHLYSLGLFGLCVFGFEAYRTFVRGFRWRDWLVAAAPFVVPAALLLLASATAELAGVVQQPGSLFHFAKSKLRAAFTPFVTYSIAFDGALVLAACAAALFGLRRGWLVLDARMSVPLALLVVVFALMPETAFGSALADYRFPIAIAFMLVGMSQLRLPLRVARAVALVVAAVVVARVGLVAERWVAFDAVYAEFAAATREVEPGGRVLAAMTEAPVGYARWSPPLMYLGNLAVIERSAFDPGLFVVRGHQPLRLEADYQELRDAVTAYLADVPGPYAAWRTPPLDFLLEPATGGKLLTRFDYVLLLYPENEGNPAPNDLVPLHVADLFHLYAVRAGDAEAAADGLRAAVSRAGR